MYAAEVLFAKALVISRPLTKFMDEVSYTETAQNRFRLKSIGLELPESKCPSTRGQVAELSLNILTGGAGKTAIAEYLQLLESPATADNWFADLGVSKHDSLPLLLIGICEAWRRLVLPYTCCPWQLLQVVRMDVDNALDFLVSLNKQHCRCPRCRDPMFAEAPLYQSLSISL